MKYVVATGAIVAAILASSVGASNLANLNYHGYGYWCKAPIGKNAIACVPMRNPRSGYSIGMHKDYIIVMKGSRIVNTLYQP